MKGKRRFLFLLIGLILGLIISVKLNFSTQLEGQVDKTAPYYSFLGDKLEDAVINVANTAGKAVVSISTEYTRRIGVRRYYSFPFGESPFPEDDFFRRFFEDFFPEFPEREYKQIGLGSGVIIDPEGYILTNEHVVGEADKITVTLPDGREFKGEIKGKDKRSDLAIVKINAHNLPVAGLGDSDRLRIGEWVVAIGNPFGFALQNPEPTVTVGVVSALHRSLSRSLGKDRDYTDLIQTDAAINPGNSGGPLVNLKGEVVGINVAIFTTSGGYQGIGFAIPINKAKRIISRLIEGKKVLYGWLGVTVQDLTEDLAKYFGLPDKNGVLVAKVLENSPAQKAGIKESDIIRKFDNKSINNTRELVNIVSQTEVGRKVKVAVIRDKKEINLDVEIGSRPENIEELSSTAISGAIWRGIEVEDLTPGNLRQYRIEEKRGVVVVNVEPNSPADEAGIMPGDVIVEINREPINNLSDYKRITQKLKGNALVRTNRGYFIIKE
ncbi:MAG: Do family serine endopeptidase [Candidatus Omnitrophica bacterium]|nr:Do family serine endopeptidase [Candidatus Omnitrophota bacterium]